MKSDPIFSAPPRLCGENSASSYDFNPALARRLCERSAAAYAPGLECGNEEIESADKETRVLISPLPPGEGQGEGGLVFAFRGTRDIRNWLTDLDCLQAGYPIVDWGACRLHLGFWKAWLSVEFNLWEFLQAHLASSTIHHPSSIFFTGHSLGGALAMIAADRFRRAEFSTQHATRNTPLVYTFGQPRVGNPNFAAMYDLALRPWTWRVVHANDIVPRVPWIPGNYRHAGQEAFYGLPSGRAERRDAQKSSQGVAALPPPENEFLVNPTPLEKLPFDLRNAVREFLMGGKLALLDDHHVNTYLCLFQKAK